MFILRKPNTSSYNTIKQTRAISKSTITNKIYSKDRRAVSNGCRPQLHFGLQSLGLAQKDSLLLLMIESTIGPSNKYIFRVGVGDILILLTV
jgi:hypothetical protein